MVQTDDEDELHPGGEPSAVPSGSEADPFSDGDALDGEEEDGEDLHEEGRAVPMGCVCHGAAAASRAAAGRRRRQGAAVLRCLSSSAAASSRATAHTAYADACAPTLTCACPQPTGTMRPCLTWTSLRSASWPASRSPWATTVRSRAPACLRSGRWRSVTAGRAVSWGGAYVARERCWWTTTVRARAGFPPTGVGEKWHVCRAHPSLTRLCPTPQTTCLPVAGGDDARRTAWPQGRLRLTTTRCVPVCLLPQPSPL